MMTDKQTFKKIGIASFIMMASVFASRFIGIFREMAIGAVGGIKSGVDAYQIAFVLPEILNHVIASGFLSITFIPIFSRYLVQGKKTDGYRIFSIILNGFGILLILFIFLCMALTPALVKVVAPGISDPETFALAVKMTRIILPAQFFFFTGGLFMAVQFAQEKFFLPALAPLIYNLSIIIGGLILGPVIGMEGFAWGVLAGAFIGNFLVQIYGIKKLGAQWFPVISLTHPDLVKYIKLTLPLMLGLTMTFSTEFMLKFFGSFLPEGRIAAMNYALRVMFIIVGLFGQAVGVASYPFMAKLAGQGKLDELNQLLNRTLQFILLVIPVSILFCVLSHEIVLVLFQRWEFDAAATQLTQSILPFFMIGAFAFSAQTIVCRGYYAMQDTLFPTIYSSICVLLSLPLIYLLMNLMGARGLAFGLSISVIIQCVVLFELWSRRSKNSDKNKIYRFMVRLLPVTGGIGIILYITAAGLRMILDQNSFSGAFFLCVIIGLEFVLLFYTAGRMFNINEITSLSETIYKRLSSWMIKLNVLRKR